MAQVTKVRLVDDIDGSEADESVEFTLDGMSLEIDLSKDNAAKLRDILAPYVAAGRREPRRVAGPTGGRLRGGRRNRCWPW